MAIGVVGGILTVIGGLMWLPDVLALFGFGIDKIRGTGLGKELLGVTDDELIEQIQTEQKRIGDQDALAVFQSDQMLEKREAGRKSFEYSRAGYQHSLNISELDRQISALEAGGRTDLTKRKQSIGGAAITEPTGAPTAPTSAEALTAGSGSTVQESRAEGRPAGLEGSSAVGDQVLLSEDEREDLRHLMIDAGLPPEEVE